MNTVKQGEVIVILFEYGTKYAIDSGYASADVNEHDMLNLNAVIEIESKENWHISPAHLSMVKLDGKPSPYNIENLAGKVRTKIVKDGHFWVMKVRAVTPSRTKKAYCDMSIYS